LKPSGPLEADQDRAQYGAHEPEEISHRGGENSDERARAVAAQLDLFAESALPGAPAPGEFDTLVAPAKRGTLRVSSDRIDSPQAAAHAFAGLRKEPSEKFQVLVLDKNDKPIAALHLFGGSISHVSVYPREVLTAVYQTPGAAKIWMAHNHPSGVAEPSRADEILRGP
jgi:DNA repair protein RadC